MFFGHLNGWAQLPLRSFQTIAILRLYIIISPTLPKSFDSVNASWNRAIDKCYWGPLHGITAVQVISRRVGQCTKICMHWVGSKAEVMMTSSVAAREKLLIITAFLGNIR